MVKRKGGNSRKTRKPASVSSLRLELRRGLSKLRVQLKDSLLATQNRSGLLKLAAVQERLRKEIRKLQAEFSLYLARRKAKPVMPSVGFEGRIKSFEAERGALLLKIRELESFRREGNESLAALKKDGNDQETALEGRVRNLERRLKSAEENYLKEKQILEHKIKAAEAETDKYRLELSVRTMFDNREDIRK